MQMTDFNIDEYSKSCVQDYLDGGMYDHFEDPGRFAEYMFQRPWYLSDYYVAGVTDLENWYGDKSAPQYEKWFFALDKALKQAENIMWGRFDSVDNR
jgi:hypothetical protein